jgi:hypothetical protein
MECSLSIYSSSIMKLWVAYYDLQQVKAVVHVSAGVFEPFAKPVPH